MLSLVGGVVGRPRCRQKSRGPGTIVLEMANLTRDLDIHLGLLNPDLVIHWVQETQHIIGFRKPNTNTKSRVCV